MLMSSHDPVYTLCCFDALVLNLWKGPTTARYWISVTASGVMYGLQVFMMNVFLCLEFLQSYSHHVNLKDRALTIIIISGKEISLKEEPAIPEPTCRKVLAEGECLPPRSMPVVPVEMKGGIIHCQDGLLDQSTALQGQSDQQCTYIQSS